MGRVINRLMSLLLGLLLAGCAAYPPQPPQIQRISAEEVERLLPPAIANLGTDDLVRLTREGVTATALIEQIRQSNSSYALTPSQTIELAKQGVDGRVLDYVQAQREQALRDGFVQEINRREREHRLEIETMQRQLLLCSYRYDPFCGPYPPVWPYYRR